MAPMLCLVSQLGKRGGREVQWQGRRNVQDLPQKVGLNHEGSSRSSYHPWLLIKFHFYQRPSHNLDSALRAIRHQCKFIL